ncbi:MAG: hypothetical protein DLM71_05720, partial [Chloroflexi bacterium]
MIAVPAIIDLDTFALARSRLEQGVRFAARNARKPSLLRGLLVCRECGYAWHRVEKGKSKRVFYQCGSRCLRTTERRCNTKPVPAGDLEQLVWGEITRLLCEPDLVCAEIDRRLRTMRETDPAQRRGETLTAELTRSERAISRLVDAYQDEQITLDELRARMPELRRRESALRAEQEAINAEIDDATNYLKLADSIETFTSRLTHGLDDMDTDEQARILQLLIRDVLIGGDNETVTIRHSIPLPSGGENPQSPLHTVRHAGASCRPTPASVFNNREGTPPSFSTPYTTSGYSSPRLDQQRRRESGLARRTVRLALPVPSLRMTMADYERPPRVLVVEDDEAIAQVLQRSLRMEGYEVKLAGDGEIALELAPAFLPDLVILDLGLPGIDGIEVAKALHKDDDVPILVLTARDAVQSRVEGLDAGADDYLVKPFERQELLARLRALLRRRPPRGQATLTVGDLKLNPDTHEVSRSQRGIDLTQREFELLEYLMRNERIVISRQRLLDEVWGYDP